MIRKHRQPTTVRQLVPSLFYLSCLVLQLAGALAGATGRDVRAPLIYLAALSGCAVTMLSKLGCKSPRVCRWHWNPARRVCLGHALWTMGKLFQPEAWRSDSRMTALSR